MPAKPTFILQRLEIQLPEKTDRSCQRKEISLPENECALCVQKNSLQRLKISLPKKADRSYQRIEISLLENECCACMQLKLPPPAVSVSAIIYSKIHFPMLPLQHHSNIIYHGISNSITTLCHDMAKICGGTQNSTVYDFAVRMQNTSYEYKWYVQMVGQTRLQRNGFKSFHTKDADRLQTCIRPHRT